MHGLSATIETLKRSVSLNRKEIIRKYKETPLPSGVFRVRNNVSMKSFVGSSPNLPGMLNRQRFQLERGSHPDVDLQKDWDAFGSDAFTFEILDEIEPSDEPGYDASEDLHVLERLIYSAPAALPLTIEIMGQRS